METRRWTNDSIPRTLTGAIWFLYAGTIQSLVLAVLDPSFLALFAAFCLVTAAYLTANARTIGWLLGVFTTSLQIVFPLVGLINDLGDALTPWLIGGTALPIATFALLIHPSSRDYQRAWFT